MGTLCCPSQHTHAWFWPNENQRSFPLAENPTIKALYPEGGRGHAPLNCRVRYAVLPIYLEINRGFSVALGLEPNVWFRPRQANETLFLLAWQIKRIK